ncbi:hypothetical protein JMJ77_0002174, partial [Colletotrichum scovillei]
MTPTILRKGSWYVG